MLPQAINHMLDLGTGNSHPQIYGCDDGVERVVKVPGLTSNQSLISDWVGSLLAVHLGILTPRPALVMVGETAITQLPEELRPLAKPGIAYSNTYIRLAAPVIGLLGLMSCPNHGPLLSSLLVLDTWIETTDRMRPNFGRNLLVDVEEAERRLLAIDFGLAFPPVLFALPGPETFDGGVATLPREVKQLLDWTIISESLAELEAISDADIVKFVGTVPGEWIDDRRRGTVVRYLIHRRAVVRPALESWRDAKA